MRPSSMHTARPHRWLALTAVTLLASACTGADNHESSATSTPPTPVVTSPTTMQPDQTTSCTAAEVRALVNQFVHAFNAGDRRTLQHLWAQQAEGFAWYSTDAPGQRIGAAASDRSTLDAYFVERHAHQEALRLTSFQFNGNTAGYANFQYTLIRQATDLAPTAYTGKGAVICDRAPQSLIVWSMAKELPSRATS